MKQFLRVYRAVCMNYKCRRHRKCCFGCFSLNECLFPFLILKVASKNSLVTNKGTGASFCEAAWCGETADRDYCSQAPIQVSFACFLSNSPISRQVSGLASRCFPFCPSNSRKRLWMVLSRLQKIGHETHQCRRDGSFLYFFVCFFFLIKLDAHTVTQMLSRGRLRWLYINVYRHFHLSWKLLRVCSCVVASGGELSAKKNSFMPIHCTEMAIILLSILLEHRWGAHCTNSTWNCLKTLILRQEIILSLVHRLIY